MTLSGGLFSRPIATLVAICTAVAGIGVPLSIDAQEAVNPNDIWYRGFLLVQQAKEFEDKGKYLEALNNLNDARPLFQGLAENFPDFQPEMIQNRRHLNAEKRDELRNLMRNRPTVSSPHGNNPGSLPQVTGNPPSQQPPATPYYGARSRETEIATPAGDLGLPAWEDGAGNVQPRISPVPTTTIGRPPSVGTIAGSLVDDRNRMDSIITRLNMENQKYRDEIASLNSELRITKSNLQAASMRISDLERQKREVEQNGNLQQKLETVTALYNQAVEGWKQANATNAKLVAQNAELQQKMKKSNERMAELERERDSLLEIVQGNGNGGSALKELMERNQKLTQQLDRAEKLASSLSESNKQKDDDIAILKSEITKVKSERDQLLAENVAHQQNINRLRDKLQMLSDGLTAEEKNSLAQASPVEKQENELLRSMVLKRLRREAQMKQAKELLLRQLDKLGSRSDILLGIVEDMANGPQLTEEEKALFKSPQFAEIVEAASSVAKDVENGTAAANQPDNSVSETLIAPGNGGNITGVIREQSVSVELEQIEKSARLDFKEKRYSEAEDGFLRYLHFRPRSVPCLCNLGVLKIAMKNYSEAEHYLEKALAIDNNSGLAHYLLGRTLFLQDKLDEALSSLEQGIAHDPKNAKAHNCVGVISSRKGWITRAEKAFTEAVQIDPDYGDAHFNLAVLYAMKDQPDAQKTEEHYKKATDLGIPRDDAIETFLDGEQIPVTVGMR